MDFESLPPSRRNVLKAGALLLAGCHSSSGAHGPSALRLAGYPVDRVQGIVSGKVAIEGYASTFERASIYQLNDAAMGGGVWECNTETLNVDCIGGDAANLCGACSTLEGEGELGALGVNTHR